MKPALMKPAVGTIAGGILLLLFAYVHFTGGRSEPAVARQAPTVNDATRRGREPWMASEHRFAEIRKTAREIALQGLDQAWVEYCGEGRSKLISGLDYYFERRSMEQHYFLKSWDESWVRHVKKTAWATADDSRIERLAQTAYGRGYFTLNDLSSSSRAAAGDVLGKERVTGKGCQ
jgi:hypothetical protein